MKKLFLLLSIIIMGCAAKEEHGQETANYIDVIKSMYNENNSKVLRIEKSVLDNGYRKDSTLLNDALEVLHHSEDVAKGKLTLNKHYESLSLKYNLIENRDAVCLNRAYGFLEQFNQNNDSVNYYNYLLNARLIESQILAFYADQMGATNLALFNTIFKEGDAARVNDPYTFIVIPYDCKFQDQSVNPDAEITVDNKKIDIPIQFKQAEGAVIASLTPTLKGKYFIHIKMPLTHKISKLTTQNTFSISFIVQ